jgi:hypothetical protein
MTAGRRHLVAGPAVPDRPGLAARDDVLLGGAVVLSLSSAVALQAGSPSTVTRGVPSRQLQADEPVKQVAIAPQRVAQALGVNTIAIPLAAQPAFALLGAGH